MKDAALFYGRNGGRSPILGFSRPLGVVWTACAWAMFAQAQPVFTWTDASGDHRWENAANWSPPGVPSGKAIAVINTGSPNATGLGAFGLDRLELNGGSLTALGLTVSQLEQNGGSLAGTNAIAPGGQWNWTSGWVSGTCTVQPGGALLVSGGENKWLGDGAVLEVEGTLNWQGPGPLVGSCLNGPAVINVRSNAVFNLAGGGGVLGRQYQNYPLTLSVAPGGRLHQSVGADSQLNNAVLDLRGEVRVETGSVSWDATAYLAEGLRLSGAGRVRMTGGTSYLNGLVTVEGARWEQSNGTLNSGGAVRTLGGGAWEWSGGWLGGGLTLTNQSVGVLSGSSPKYLGPGAELHNYGVIEWREGTIQGQCLNGPATIHNHAPGRFIVAAAVLLNRQYGNYEAMFSNDGALALGTPGGLVSGDWSFSQSGSGVMELLLAGTTPGTEFGGWTTVRALSLAGALRVGLAAGYWPDAAKAFPVLTANSLMGRFATARLPSLPDGLLWELDRTATELTLRLRGAPGCVAPPAGLIGWWPGDGDANDLAGMNHGVLLDGATATSSGVVAQAFDFDGTNDFLQAASPFEDAAAFTFAFWLNLHSFTHPHYMPVFAHTPAADPRPAGTIVFYAGDPTRSWRLIPRASIWRINSRWRPGSTWPRTRTILMGRAAAFSPRWAVPAATTATSLPWGCRPRVPRWRARSIVPGRVGRRAIGSRIPSGPPCRPAFRCTWPSRMTRTRRRSTSTAWPSRRISSARGFH